MSELTKLGRYKLSRVLGRGAMGVVYEGLDPSLNRRVAIKTILKNAAIDEDTARAYSAQFAREAQAAGRLNHPNIVQVHDFAEEGEVAYLVMEFIQGRELRSCFEAKEKFAPAEAVRIMGELLDALEFAHEAGVIHRDVKPANVMLDARRRVKLADFGVARIQDSERSAAGTMVGTPAFMSPEQISGGKIDRRTDLFSAGVVLYQLLTGEQPFTGAGAWTVAKKIMQDDPPRPSTVARSVSPVFDAIVNKALAKNPAERFASAKDFAAALRGANAGDPQATVQGPAANVPKPRAGAAPKASEAEVEFWRAIQNSGDPAEFEFYLEQFAEGTYAQLARHKIGKLREPLEAARKEREEKIRLEAEERARREAEERAQREAQEEAKREAEASARREAEARARREAAEKAKRDADEKARREREAQALARLKQQEQAAARAKSTADDDATVAMARPVAPKKNSYWLPVVAVALLAIGGAAAFLAMNRKPAPVPSPVAEAPPKAAAPAIDEQKIRRETEERLRKEFAEKAAGEKAAMEKAVAEKAAAEKAAADKLAAAKTAAEKEAAEKAAQKATADRVAAEKAAAEKAASAKAAADKAVAEKAAAEKAAAERAAAEKAAAEKVAARPAPAAPSGRALPSVGDRWVYEAWDANRPERKQEIQIEAQSVAASGIQDSYRAAGGPAFSYLHKPGAYVVGGGGGIAMFSPYLRSLQAVREGQGWSNVPFERLSNCSTDPAIICTINARFAGREKVAVRAGTYDAWKVEVELRVKTPGPARFYEYVYWYADDTKRMVKFRGRLRSGGGGAFFPDTDMELVSYVPAGSGAAAAPAPAAPASPMSSAPLVAAVAPVAAAAERKPGWPAIGDRWTYAGFETNHPEKKFDAAVEVRATSGSSVQDVFSVPGSGAVALTHTAGAQFVGLAPGVVSFSPYLRAFQEIRAGDRWSIDPQRIGKCGLNPSVDCSGSARVVGRERVSVKAGSYDAWKIVVTMRARSMSGPLSTGFGSLEIEYSYWFAEEVKRFVKYQSRARGVWDQPDADMELVSYSPK